jgi:hypothetical protein
MAAYVSTEQYLWGLHRILGGITAREATSDGLEPAETHGRTGLREAHSA